MATNLIDMFHNTVGELLAKQSAGILGESVESTTSAIKAIVPTLLGTIIQKSSSDQGLTSLMNFMSEHNIDGSILSNVTGMLGGGIETEKLMYGGAGILRYLLDDKLSPVVDIIASGSGLKTSSATSLLKLSAPLVMGIIGRHVKEKGLDQQGLKSVLSSQIEYVKPGIPAGLGNLLGLGTISTSFAQASTPGPVTPASQSGTPGSPKILPWIVLGLASLAIFYFVQKGCGAPETPPSDVMVEAKDTIAPAPQPEPSNPNKTYNLPGGGVLTALPGSFTASLADFLASAEPTEKCLAFDQVRFESGSFKLASGSEAQLKELVSLLNAYPQVKVDLVGYTDDAGDDGKNKSLSKERTKVIKTWLTDHGIAAGRLDAKGMGEENPIASNKTEMGREKNRRVEVCVRKK